MPAKMTYNGPMALVNLRNYPMTENDRWQYFTFSDGQVLTAYADPLDGRSKSALPELTVCARESSCARLALAAAPLFIADAVEDAQLDALAQAGSNAVWFRGNTLHSCGAEITPILTEGAQTKYSIAK